MELSIIISSIRKKLNLRSEVEDQKTIKRLVEGAKNRNLLDDVLHIRRHGDYIPNYNKPKLYTEYKLIQDGVEVSGALVTSCKRPVDFGDDYGLWLNTIHIENKKEQERKEMEQLQEQHRKEFFKDVVSPYFMNKMTKLN